MAALSSGLVTLTFVLLLLSSQLSAWKSPHGKPQHQHMKGAPKMKLKYADLYSGYYPIPDSRSPMVVPRPPTLGAAPSYLHNNPKSGNQNKLPIARLPGKQSSPGIGQMAQVFVDEHNKVRNVYGVAQLTWNSQLVPSAQRLASACAFRHTDNNPYGENIAAGQTSPQEVVSQWVEGPEEKQAWDPRNPQDSHFTQVVWEDTRELGCAVTSCPTMAGVSLPQSPIQFWVCEYNPSGNVETLYLKNVHALAGGAPSRR